MACDVSGLAGNDAGIAGDPAGLAGDDAGLAGDDAGLAGDGVREAGVNPAATILRGGLLSQGSRPAKMGGFS